MNIHIIGGGAVGLFFASQWSEDHQVTVRTRTENQAEAINREGIHVWEKGLQTVAPVKAEKLGSIRADLVVVAIKQYQMESILSLLHCASAHSVLFLQNGLAHLDLMGKLPQKHLYAASVEHGIAKLNDYTIQVNGRNKTNISFFRGGTKEIAEKLGTDSFRFEWEESVHQMLIGKMAANAVINPLTAILAVENGELALNHSYRLVAWELCREFASVFPFKTVEETFESVMAICEKTAANESSMLKDLKAGRLTEIDAIVGAVLREAVQKNISTPSFKMIYSMVKGKEHTSAIR